ncbi:hypothetical protein [Aestuariivivens sediminicola]|uniref:hypothetical protein n=1 Tax=Aestuariivivens sediminicola TaxID=2913560 RepID=UPI001F56A24F|nr:hypothetical protein [Aestuariivivens sediminicola]
MNKTKVYPNHTLRSVITMNSPAISICVVRIRHARKSHIYDGNLWYACHQFSVCMKDPVAIRTGRIHGPRIKRAVTI